MKYFLILILLIFTQNDLGCHILEKTYNYLLSKMPLDSFSKLLLQNYTNKTVCNIEMEVIQGNIPKDINGMYIRNTMNPQYYPKHIYNAADADSMIQIIRFNEGKVIFCNDYLKTDRLKNEILYGKETYSRLIQMMQSFKGMSATAINAMMQKSKCIKQLNSLSNGSANTSLQQFNNKIYALQENNLPLEFNLFDTNNNIKISKEKFETFDNKWNYPFTAHPKVMNDEMYFFGYQFMKQPTTKQGRLDKNGKLVESFFINTHYKRMIHDFNVTEKQAIINDLPYEFSIKNAALTGKPFLFDKNKKSYQGVFPKTGKRTEVLPNNNINDKIKWFELDNHFVFHYINAYDQSDNIIKIRACYMNEVDIFQMQTDEKGYYPNKAKLVEITLNLNTMKHEIKYLLENKYVEFPIINPEQEGIKNKYAYLSVYTKDSFIPNKLTLFKGFIKYDFENNTQKEVIYDNNYQGAEVMFIPKDDIKSEDDGYIVSQINNNDNDKLLIIYDSKDLKELVRIKEPVENGTFAVHGTYINYEQLKSLMS